MTELFLIALMIETAVFGFGIMLYLSKVGKLFKEVSYGIRTNAIQDIRTQVIQPQLQHEKRRKSVIETALETDYPVQLPIDPCQNCGLSLGEHTIIQAINCGYQNAKNIKVKELKDPSKIIKTKK